MPSEADKSDWKQFGKWLRQRRLAAGFSQVKVAGRAGITNIHYARIERGSTGTKSNTIILLAQAIGIGEAEMLNKAGFNVSESDAEGTIRDKEIQQSVRSLEELAVRLAQIHSKKDRQAVLEDIKVIAKSMIDREVAAQERHRWRRK